MQPSDIGLVANVGEVAVSPGGDRVAYTLTTTVDNQYRTRIWTTDVAGGASHPLTNGARADVLPRWSPDGSMLAWVSVVDGGAHEVHVLAVGPGEPVAVLSWPDEIGELAWSPTGDRLAFVGRVRDEATYGAPGTTLEARDVPPRRITHLYSRLNGEGFVHDRPLHVHVVPLDGSVPPLDLTPGPYDASDMAWSPDGTSVAFVSARRDDRDLDVRNDVWLVDAAGGEPQQISRSPGAWQALSWSPDGTRLAAFVDPTPGEGPRHGQLWTLDPSTGETDRLAETLDRNLSPYGSTRPPVWSGTDLLVAIEDQGRIHVGAVSAAGVRLVVSGERVVRSFDAAGPTVAFSASAFEDPGDVWVTGLAADEEPVRLTHHAATFQGRVRLAGVETYTAVSSGGIEVQCWAVAPLDAEPGVRYPTVLNIHGGPFSQYGVGFFDEFQFQAAAGFGVIYCNPRGSSGYSEAWGRAVRWPEASVDPGSGWGGVDYDDVTACVDAAIEHFEWIDPDRLGIQGGSYGGYLTSWTVGHTDRFVAAVSERAANNLVTLEHNSDIAGSFREYVGWTHLERPELYARQSPSSFVEAMTTPMLLVHSEDDLRCPISQAEELFVSLRLLGREPEMVRFPGEDHELSRSGSPTHRRQRAELILDWFDRHLRR